MEKILNLSLEIILHLTGEDYTVVKTSSDRCQASLSEGLGGILSPIPGPPPHPRIHEEINDHKVLYFTNKMMELLTGEVPIRCQDVTVYLSMEEWEYLEGHKERYKEVMMEEHQPRTSPGLSSTRTTPERCPAPPPPPQDPQMIKDKDNIMEKILHLSLDIIFHLTGEDYIVVKTSSDRCQAPVSEGRGGSLSPILVPPPHPRIHEDINDQKILELTNKMLELLTGEVPIRCQDVTVYFSMEEWEYLEGHKERYKEVMMEEPQPRTSPGLSSTRTTPERCPAPPPPPQDPQLLDPDKDLNNINSPERNVRGSQRSKEEIPTDHRPDSSADVISLGARSAGLSNQARRALWLKGCPGDLQSKYKLCAVPCDGHLLFGKQLEDVLDKASEGKKSFPRFHSGSSRPFRRQRFSKGRPPDNRRWERRPKRDSGFMFEGAQPPQRSLPSDARLPVGGRLSHFLEQWESISSNAYVRSIIRDGLQFQFLLQPPQRFVVTPLRGSQSEQHALESEIRMLIGKAVLCEVPVAERGKGFYSPLFLVGKPDGSFRTIINLRRLNQFFQYFPFKMESVQSAIKLLFHTTTVIWQ
ncbi:uncharacterized protein LOC142261093 [Anomaloglossus baeobatrachus]|uniref:uncharacterized protein LOC142261093 n=1 Tax=Anomaloglossus baeobatrachus TaxID=238106 RepID=UPI003F5016B9